MGGSMIISYTVSRTASVFFLFEELTSVGTFPFPVSSQNDVGQQFCRQLAGRRRRRHVGEGLATGWRSLPWTGRRASVRRYAPITMSE